ncbi:MAG: sigma-E processing peptidase SpoIIGA [Suilimivivens sp.]
MQRIIYIDSIFLNNFIMDLLLLSLTAKTLKTTTTFFKTLVGSLIGAAGYCLILCLPGSYSIKVMFGMLPVAALMLKIGCNLKRLKEFFYGMGYLFCYSFFIGGFILFLRKKIPFLSERNDSFGVLILTGCLGFLICKAGIEKYGKEKKNHFCKIILPGDQGEITVYGLIDTGNGLKDPVSGKEVAVLEEKVWEGMQKCKRAEKYKIIPFHSIGKENGILEGYQVDQIRIEEKTGFRNLENVIIAVFKGNISAKGDYQIILPPQWF